MKADQDYDRYRWSALYAPKGLFSPAFWSLLQGWITLFAWIAQLTQVTFITGGIIEGIVIQNQPTYIPARWHGTLIAWAVLTLPLLANIFGRKLLVKLELVAGLANVLFFLITVIVLAVMAPKSSASFVFESTFAFSGWTLPGVSWCVGLLSSAFPLQGFDGVIHMSAEVKYPERNVPRAMILAVIINGASAFCFIITILFTIGDYQAALNSPTYYPIIEGE